MTHGAGSSILGNRLSLQYTPLTARFRTKTIGPSGMLFGIGGRFVISNAPSTAWTRNERKSEQSQLRWRTEKRTLLLILRYRKDKKTNTENAVNGTED